MSRMKINVKNLNGENVGDLTVPDILFGKEWNADLVHQVVVSQDANSRISWAHAKDRSEVRGGGKKPWKQKGTGRARHGSIRSPLWIGGGATFGPRKEKNYSKKVNKKMKKQAILSILSKRYLDGEISIIDKIIENNKKELKTKNVLKKIEDVLNSNGSLMIIFSNKNKGLYKFVRNIKKVYYLSPKSLNVKDLLRANGIFIEKNAIEEIVNHYKLS